MRDVHALLQRVSRLRIGVRKGVHAPHKPLLMLYALGRLTQGQSECHYAEVDAALENLLKEFGPHRSRYHPEYPFWRLQNDGLWNVSADGVLGRRRGGTDVKRSELLKKNAVGNFVPAVREVLTAAPENVGILAKRLLDEHFPTTLHGDILNSVGLTLDGVHETYKSKSDFRRKILRAYEYRCCVCGYDLRLADRSAGLEAAHIMWHQVGGPDEEQNGLALCVLHHKLFDVGAFTIDANARTVVCSEELNGGGRLEWILGYHGRELSPPQRRQYYPGGEYVAWHRNTVFRGPARAQ